MIGLNQQDNEDEKEEKEIEKAQSRSRKEMLKDARSQVEDGRLMFEYNVEGIIVSSKLLYARFSSLMQAGFNENQAMSIILERGLM